jgi:catechol 2,3-dioxygenase-like lactoylglutathione lyase family enzyme
MRERQEETSMFRRVDHLALHVADVKETSRFYVDILGFEQVPHVPGTNPNVGYVKLGEMLIELTTRPGGEPMSGFHFCLEAIDFDVAIEALQAHGLTMTGEPRPSAARTPNQQGWHRAVFLGPHGETIEVKGGKRARAVAE